MSCKLLVLPVLALALQGQVRVPQMGAIRCADNAVRPVYGVPAAFVLGKPLATSALAVSFSASGGIVATRSAILLLNSEGKLLAQSSVSDPAASVDIETDPASAIAWLPAASLLLTWDGSKFQQMAVADPPSGRVTSLRRDSSSAYLLVAGADGSISEYAILLSSGEILSNRYLPGVTGSPLAVGALLLFPNETGITIQSAAGTQSIRLSGAGFAMEKMGSEWVHVTASNSSRNWALHLAADDTRLYELPGISALKESK